MDHILQVFENGELVATEVYTRDTQTLILEKEAEITPNLLLEAVLTEEGRTKLQEIKSQIVALRQKL